jgi:hypothetical protein
MRGTRDAKSGGFTTRQRRQNARPVARVGLGAACAAVIHAAQEMVRVAHDLMAALTLDVRDKTDAAAVVLGVGTI